MMRCWTCSPIGRRRVRIAALQSLRALDAQNFVAVLSGLDL